MIIKNLKKYFSFEVQVLDDKNVRRRFRASNYQVTVLSNAHVVQGSLTWGVVLTGRQSCCTHALWWEVAKSQGVGGSELFFKGAAPASAAAA
jgi:hypothetical protein